MTIEMGFRKCNNVTSGHHTVAVKMHLEYWIQTNRLDIQLCIITNSTSNISTDLVMAALHRRCGRYIFVLFLLLLSWFSPRLISAVADWMSTNLLYMVWP